MKDPNVQEPTTGLTSSRFERLLDGLDSNRDLAGRKYEDLRWMLIRFFEWNSFVNAEDLADETLNRVARKLDDQEIRNIAAFAWGVAKNIRREASEQNMRCVSITDVSEQNTTFIQQESDENRIHDRIDGERRRLCLDRCIRRLSPENRALFIAYHAPSTDPATTRQQLAQSLGITIAALRMQVIRMREQLRQCAERCIASTDRNSR